MTVPRHLEDAAARLKAASTRIHEAKRGPITCENQQVWLEALTDYCEALAEVQTFGNESVHEKLHELAGRIGLKRFASEARP